MSFLKMKASCVTVRRGVWMVPMRVKLSVKVCDLQFDLNFDKNYTTTDFG